MKFTVVIPCYNSSKTITRAIESVLNQKNCQSEIIIIDDASKDQKYLDDIVISYIKRGVDIKYIKNSTNMNGAHARNTGINAAKEKYIAFLDSDDYWVENRLESATNIINAQVNQRFLIYGKFELLRKYSTGALLPTRSIKSDELVTEYVFSSSQNIQTSTFVCPTEIAKEIKFDVKLTRHQDTDFAMRAQEAGVSLVFEDNKCAFYCFSPTDLKERVAAGRVSSKYCDFWLKYKKSYFSKKSIAGYNLLVYSKIKFIENNKLDAFIIFINSITKLGMKNIIDICHVKYKIITQSRLGF